MAANRTMRVIVPVADIKSRPEAQADLTSQLLMGDEVRLIERCGDFYAIQSLKDDYRGYIAVTSLRTFFEKVDTGFSQKNTIKQEIRAVGDDLTHYVRVPRTFLYPQADMKSPIVAAFSLGSKLTIVDFVAHRGTHYGLLADGTALIADHLALLGNWAADYVSIAEMLERTPYLWGGASAFGIDCSGLVQLALGVTGQAVARDSSEQAQTIGQALPQDCPLQRGDLVFWRGHVAIMRDAQTLIHANGASMDVRCEAYTVALARIASHYGQPIGTRRP